MKNSYALPLKRILFLLFSIFTIGINAQNTYTVINTSDDGAGSLRQALLDAEGSEGADIIDMTGISGTITLLSALPNISQDLTINGPESGTLAINGDNQFRIFFIWNETTAPTVSINDLTLQNGYAKGGDGTGNAGGGLGAGGAIYVDNGTLTLTNMIFDSNQVLGGTGGNSGSSSGGVGGDGPFVGLGGTGGFPGTVGGFGAGGGGGAYASGFAAGGNGGVGGFGGGGGGGGGSSIDANGSGRSGGSFGGNGANGLNYSSSYGGGGAGLGGAVFIRAGDLNIKDSEFNNNTATRGLGGTGSNSNGGNGQGKGGAIFIIEGDVTASAIGITFSGNTASNAGTIDTDNNDLYGTVEITTPITIKTQPTDQVVTQGGQADFYVTALGSNPTYQWQYFDGSDWIDMVAAPGELSGATTDALTVICVDIDQDDLQIRVVITGTLNTITSDEVSLTVNAVDPLSVTIVGESEINCTAGKSITYTATPSNVDDEPVYQWYLNDELVDGATSTTFTRTMLEGDVVKVTLSDPGTCYSRSVATSNEIEVSLVPLKTSYVVTSTSGDVNVEGSLPWVAQQIGNYPCYVDERITIDLSQLPDNSEIVLTDRIQILSPTEIFGSGADNLTISRDGDEVIRLFSNYQGQSGTSVLRDLSLVGVLEFFGDSEMKNLSVTNSDSREAVTVSNGNVIIDNMKIDNSGSSGGLEINLCSSGTCTSRTANLNNLQITGDGIFDIVQQEYTGGGTGINFPAGATNANRSEVITITNSYIKNHRDGLRIDNIYAEVSLENSSIYNNSGYGVDNVGKLTIKNSTVSSNGYIGVESYPQNGGDTKIINSSIINNTNRGVFVVTKADISNSIILGNSPNIDISGIGTASSGHGHNIYSGSVSWATNAVTTGNQIINTASDIINLTLTDPASNGIQVHELVPCSSTAINAADATIATDKDQLGRPRAGIADIGAVESFGSIQSLPSDQNVFAGNAVSFSVSVASSGTPTYQWEVNDGSGFVDLANDDTYTGADASVLSIANPTIALNNNQYRVTVNDGCDVTTPAVTLRISTYPTADNNTVTATEDAVFTFSESDFNFSDEDGDAFGGFQVITDVVIGTLLYDGNAVSLSTNLLDPSLLTFEPDADEYGDAYTSFEFKVSDNSETGFLSLTSYILTIDVTNVNDGPTGLTISATSVQENSAIGTEIGIFTTTDIDSESFNYTMVSGSGSEDNSAFSIDGASLKVATALDFETKTSYSIRVATSDGSLTAEATFTISVTDVSESATEIVLSNTSINENSPVGKAIGKLTAPDPDAVNNQVFSLEAGITDNDRFTIGVNDSLSASEVFDFEAKSSYTVTVKVDDGSGNSYSEAIVITVLDLNEAPTALNLSATTLDENAAVGTTIGTFKTVDQDNNDTHTYTLESNFGDNSLFSLSGSSLVSAAVFDFETKSSYSIKAIASDAKGLSVSSTFTITINNLVSPQTIDFTQITAKTFGDAAFDLSATSSSSLPVTYTSSDVTVATISGSTVTIIGAGETVITASQAGNDDFSAATAVPQTLVVNKAAQTITFAQLEAKTFGDAAFDLSATSSSSLPVTYTSSDVTVATISGSTVTIVGAGETVITASQASNDDYSAATAVPQTLVVNKATQTITFAALAEKSFGDAAFELAASSSSQLSVTYSSSNPEVATLSGSTVTIVGAGEAMITASQAGDANYSAATDVTQTLVVNKASQAITFGALAEKTFGDATFELSASSSSELSVTYISSNEDVVTIAGTTVTIVGAGEVEITASQAGDDDYNAAADVTQTLVVNKAPQTITFGVLADLRVSPDPITLSGEASSGLPVTYSVAGNATVAGNLLTFTGAGEITVTAMQEGNVNFLPATDVVRTFNVEEAIASPLALPISLSASVYPNPFVDQLIIENANHKNLVWQLYDLSGTVVKLGSATGRIVVEVDDLKTGIYIIRLTSETEGQKEFRVIKN